MWDLWPWKNVRREFKSLRPTTGNGDRAAKPEILISLKLRQITSNFQRQIRHFMTTTSSICVSSDCDKDGQPEISARLQDQRFRYGSQYQSPVYSFFDLVVVKNPRLAVGISILSVIVSKILAFSIWAAILSFGCPPASYFVSFPWS